VSRRAYIVLRLPSEGAVGSSPTTSLSSPLINFIEIGLLKSFLFEFSSAKAAIRAPHYACALLSQPLRLKLKARRWF